MSPGQERGQEQERGRSERADSAQRSAAIRQTNNMCNNLIFIVKHELEKFSVLFSFSYFFIKFNEPWRMAYEV